MAKKEIKAPSNYLNDRKDVSLRRDLLNSSMTSRSSESNREGNMDWNSTISSKLTKSSEPIKKRKIEVDLLEDENEGTDMVMLTMYHRISKEVAKFNKMWAVQEKKNESYSEKFKVLTEVNKRNQEVINRLESERIANALDGDQNNQGNKNVKKRKFLTMFEVDEYFRLKFNEEFDLEIGNFSQIEAVM
jgi:hypothetical protein